MERSAPPLNATRRIADSLRSDVSFPGAARVVRELASGLRHRATGGVRSARTADAVVNANDAVVRKAPSGDLGVLPEVPDLHPTDRSHALGEEGVKPTSHGLCGGGVARTDELEATFRERIDVGHVGQLAVPVAGEHSLEVGTHTFDDLATLLTTHPSGGGRSTPHRLQVNNHATELFAGGVVLEIEPEGGTQVGDALHRAHFVVGDRVADDFEARMDEEADRLVAVVFHRRVCLPPEGVGDFVESLLGDLTAVEQVVLGDDDLEGVQEVASLGAIQELHVKATGDDVPLVAGIPDVLHDQTDFSGDRLRVRELSPVASAAPLVAAAPTLVLAIAVATLALATATVEPLQVFEVVVNLLIETKPGEDVEFDVFERLGIGINNAIGEDLAGMRLIEGNDSSQLLLGEFLTNSRLLCAFLTHVSLLSCVMPVCENGQDGLAHQVKNLWHEQNKMTRIHFRAVTNHRRTVVYPANSPLSLLPSSKKATQTLSAIKPVLSVAIGTRFSLWVGFVVVSLRSQD